jgi:hypothetical protein
LVPFVTSAAFAATGSVGYALLYPIAVPAVCFVLALFLMPASGNRKRLKQQPSKADHVRGRSAPHGLSTNPHRAGSEGSYSRDVMRTHNSALTPW